MPAEDSIHMLQCTALTVVAQDSVSCNDAVLGQCTFVHPFAPPCVSCSMQLPAPAPSHTAVSWDADLAVATRHNTCFSLFADISLCNLQPCTCMSESIADSICNSKNSHQDSGLY